MADSPTHVDSMTELEFVAFLADKLGEVARDLNLACESVRDSNERLRGAFGLPSPRPRLALVRDEEPDNAS
jgi:hypothetical protein